MKVIIYKGPFVTVRSVQRSFSGKNQRPSAGDVVAVFKEDALGKMEAIEKTTVFFKALSFSETRNNIGLTTYFNLFTELCSTSHIRNSSISSLTRLKRKMCSETTIK